MAQFPHFVFSPNSLLSLIGLLRGPDTTTPTPSGDWRAATVDVIIPALNEQDNIVRCLESVLRQTRRPRRIVVVDDGSSDATAVRARAFGNFYGVDLLVIQRFASIGKTPTIKDQARGLDSDVIFILDADTILESDDYLERTVQELYQGVGIASACGTVLPLRDRDRRAADRSHIIRLFAAGSSFTPAPRKGWLRRASSGLTNLYREVLYLFLQRFIYRGQMALFGTLTNPVGCAVAYRRTYLKTLFDAVEPELGDDLTNSEDIFIGLAMLSEGYRNIQVPDVYARTVEPEVQRLPRQIYLWSSAFLQSAFYFDDLLKGPFKALKRRRARGGPKSGSGGTRERVALPAASVAYAGAGSAVPPHALLSVAADFAAVPGRLLRNRAATPETRTPSRERRLIQEPYRQAFGRKHTKTYGRAIGWALLSSAVEKIGFPTVLLMMALFQNWEGLLVTIGAETFLTVLVLVIAMKGRRLEFLLKGIAVTPLRYALLASEVVTIARFALDVWVTKDRRWRK